MAADDSILPTKVCTTCDIRKPLDAFRRDHKSKGGYRNQCRSCRNSDSRKRTARRTPEEKAKQSLKNKTYYAANRLHIRQVQRIYYTANAGTIAIRMQRYQVANNAIFILCHQRRRARKQALPSTLTAEEQAFCRAYFHYACAVCGNEEGFQWLIALDHWIPLDSSVCPGTIATNMIPLCHGIGGCNNAKGTKEPEAWLVERFGTRKGTAILKRIKAYFAVVRQRQAS